MEICTWCSPYMCKKVIVLTSLAVSQSLKPVLDEHAQERLFCLQCHSFTTNIACINLCVIGVVTVQWHPYHTTVTLSCKGYIPHFVSQSVIVL